MKTISAAAMAEIVAGTAIVTGAVEIQSTPVIRVWGGHWVINLDGNDYQPLGDRGTAQQTSGALGGVAQGMTLTLSGIEAAALALLDASEVKRAPVVIRRMIFKGDGKTLLDWSVWDRGKLDTLTRDETVGGPAAINVAIESAARGLGRSGARMRSDADQRLIRAADGYFKNAAYAGQKALYWGGKRPAFVGQVIGGGSGGGGDYGDGGGRFNMRQADF